MTYETIIILSLCIIPLILGLIGAYIYARRMHHLIQQIEEQIRNLKIDQEDMIKNCENIKITNIKSNQDTIQGLITNYF